MKIISGGITAPKGFLSCGIHCGIKFIRKDLALIYSQEPCVACGLFTQNKVQAAPITVTKRHLQDNRAQAIIVNSGNANCCTGREGINDSKMICRQTGKELAIAPKDVLVASTGIIGRRLSLEKIQKGISLLAQRLSSQGSLSAAEAIMTTDTKPKQISVSVKIGKAQVKIGGVAKGAGMIQPNLATMLAFITTDVKIDKIKLKKALQEAAERSFNLITVDGDTSTNDMVLVMANGLAGNSRLGAGGLKRFQQALNFVCLSLAKMIVNDGEGASKFVEIAVEQAKNHIQAKKVAFKVANSPLVKTALFGEKPNWGRIAACVGAADEAIKADKLNIYLGKIKVLQKGAATKTNKLSLREIFKEDEIQIRITLGLGRFAARVFSCDLSDKYVKINAEY